MAQCTGSGATVTFTSIGMPTGVTWRVRSVSAMNFSIEALDDTAINSTSYMEKCFSPLIDAEPVEIELYWDYTAVQAVSGKLFDLGDVGSITITFPTDDAVTEGNIILTGALTAYSMPAQIHNERTVGTVTFQYDGKTDPTYTASS